MNEMNKYAVKSMNSATVQHRTTAENVAQR